MATPQTLPGIQATPSWFGGTSYRVPSRAEPSFWGEDTSFGLMMGSLLSLGLTMLDPMNIMTGGAGSVASFALHLAPVLVGGAIGAVVNKSRMEKELEEGKEISPPSFLNRGLLEGTLHGVGIVSLINFASSFVMETSLLSTATSASTFLAGLTGWGMAAVAVAAGIGAVRAAMKRQDDQEHVYNFVENSHALQNGLPMKEKSRGITQYVAPVAGVATAIAAGLPGDPIGVGSLLGDKHGAAAMLAENIGGVAAQHKPSAYPDFSDIADHPAHRRGDYSFADAELARRGARGVSTPAAGNADAPNYGQFTDRLSDQRMADAVTALQDGRS